MIKFNYLFCFFIFFGCKAPEKADFGSFSKFYPPQKVLEKGIAYKYYIHSFQFSEDEAIDIEYQTLQLIGDTLYESKYNSGLIPRIHRKLVIEDDKILMTECQKINRFRDTSHYEFVHNVFFSWDSDTIANQFVVNEPLVQHHRKLSLTQHSMRDTIINELQGKIFQFDYESILESERDTSLTEATSRSTYLENIGLFAQEYHEENRHYFYELFEQMSLKKFNELKAHNMHDVGYIDPKTVINPDPTFQACHPEKTTFEYYNGDPDANLKGKKGTKWKFIKELLDPNIIEGETGLLSVRFMINCKGEQGHFTVEQSDLNYQEHSFRPKTIEHLVKITKAMEPWTPTIIMDKKRDSYAYLMYKIKNGKIIEILP